MKKKNKKLKFRLIKNVLWALLFGTFLPIVFSWPICIQSAADRTLRQNIEDFVFVWAVLCLPVLTITIIATQLYYSKTKPKILLWLPVFSMVIYSAFYYPIVFFWGMYAQAVDAGVRSADSGMIYFIFFILGNALFFSISIIPTIFLYHKKQEKK